MHLDERAQNLIAAFREIAHLSDDTGIDLDSDVSAQPDWDSVCQIELIVNAEQIYGIRLGEDDLRDCRTLAQFVTAAERRTHADAR
ncbi:acyl carrier protein [Streptacidiphilus sp. MAP12-33]|uniref:acyl carrier protein n=1 Tax=Streptacidiphilus sp. MAP12-33 TaxID=3156266 RepID=UPI0035156CC2